MSSVVVRYEQASARARAVVDDILAADADDRAWVEQLGPALRGVTVARMLGVSPQRVSSHTGLLRLTMRSGHVGYPLFQFVGGRQLDGIADIVRLLRPVVATEWTIASWLTSPNADLRGETPVDFLQVGGDRELTIAAAERFAAPAGTGESRRFPWVPDWRNKPVSPVARPGFLAETRAVVVLVEARACGWKIRPAGAHGDDVHVDESRRRAPGRPPGRSDESSDRGACRPPAGHHHASPRRAGRCRSLCDNCRRQRSHVRCVGWRRQGPHATVGGGFPARRLVGAPRWSSPRSVGDAARCCSVRRCWKEGAGARRCVVVDRSVGSRRPGGRGGVVTLGNRGSWAG